MLLTVRSAELLALDSIPMRATLAANLNPIAA
jgi:hypothetical protein